MPRIVMKFGGTSVADLERIRSVAARVRREVDAGNEVAVVVSAMAGATNQLVGWCSQLAPLHDAREYDAVVASGEQVTSGLLAIALQALGVELALADGLPANRLLLGAVPDWVAQDRNHRSILVQAWLRHLVFPDHRLVVEEPLCEVQPRGRDSALVAALSGAPAALVIRDRDAGRVADSAADLGAAAAAAAALRAALGVAELHGDAAELAVSILQAADAALEQLTGEGWGSLLGPAGSGQEVERLGRAAVVERATGPTSGERLLEGLA